MGSYTYGDTAHPDAATAIGSAWTASYDAAGNMTCRAATSATTCAGSSPTGAQLSYDNQGQLAAWQNAPTSPTSSASYLYDGEGHRVEQVAATGGTTTTTSYIGSLEEVSVTGATTTTTAYYGGLALAVNGALRYTLSDGLGSLSAAVDAATGAVLATQLYAPYGGVRYQSGTLPTDKGFTGQVSDAATSGLDYYGARYYDPVAGQFTSADSILPKQGATPDPSQLNRYAYVAGNPETKTDPTGHAYTLTRSGAPTICTSVTVCIPSNPGTSYNPPSHESGSASTANQNPVQVANQGGVIALDTVGANLALRQSNQKAFINWLIQEIKYYSASKWSRSARPLRNAKANLADAEEGLDFLNGAGNVLIAIGAILDAGQYGYTFLLSSNLPHVTGGERLLASAIAGILHSLIVTSATVGASVGVTAALSTASGGILAIIAPILSYAAGLGAGWLASNFADWAVPKIMAQPAMAQLWQPANVTQSLAP